MEDKKKKTFIAYLDDDDKKKEVWCDIKFLNDSFVTFEYNNESITIPFHRILKLKSKGKK